MILGSVASAVSRVLFGFLLRSARNDLRWRIDGPLDDALRSPEPFVLTAWHQDILLLYHFLCMRIAIEGRGRLVSLSSRSVDGDIAVGVLRPWRIRSVRGSSGKEGAGPALRELRQAIGAGESVVLIGDGPQPPPFVLRNGPLFLARETGAPLYVARAWARPQILWPRIWFRMSIPLPRAEVALLSAGPVDLSGDLEESRRRAEAALERLRVEADARLYLRRGRASPL